MPGILTMTAGPDLEAVGDPVRELFEVERLAQGGHGTHVAGQLEQGAAGQHLAAPGHCDHFRAQPFLAHRPQEIDPIYFGHEDVYDGDVDLSAAEDSDRLRSVPRFANTVAVGLELFAEDASEGRLVVDDEDRRDRLPGMLEVRWQGRHSIGNVCLLPTSDRSGERLRTNLPDAFNGIGHKPFDT